MVASLVSALYGRTNLGRSSRVPDVAHSQVDQPVRPTPSAAAAAAATSTLAAAAPDGTTAMPTTTVAQQGASPARDMPTQSTIRPTRTRGHGFLPVVEKPRRVNEVGTVVAPRMQLTLWTPTGLRYREFSLNQPVLGGEQRRRRSGRNPDLAVGGLDVVVGRLR
jgi:hypothetical protein